MELINYIPQSFHDFYFPSQTSRPHRMHEEVSEIFHHGSHLARPGDLALEHHIHWIHIVQVRPQCQQKHPAAREQTLLLVNEALLEDEVALDEPVPLVVLFLGGQTASHLVRRYLAGSWGQVTGPPGYMTGTWGHRTPSNRFHLSL